MKEFFSHHRIQIVTEAHQSALGALSPGVKAAGL